MGRRAMRKVCIAAAGVALSVAALMIGARAADSLAEDMVWYEASVNNTTNTTTTTTPAPTPPHNESNTTTPAPTEPHNGTTHAPTSAAPTIAPQPMKLETELSSLILAGAWIPFMIVMGVAFVVSLLYVKHYQHRRERECSSTTIAVLALTIALTTLALVPVDIFLVSQQKLSDDGTYKFSSAQVDEAKSLTQDAYYAMYAFLLMFAFFFLPMAYFYFEEKDEEAGTTCCTRFIVAIKYTMGFLVFMAIMLLIGAFAVAKKKNDCTFAFNATKSAAECSGKFAEDAITQNSGANSVSFTIGLLAVIGFIYFGTYTATGLVSMPIKMIRSRGRASKAERTEAEEEINAASSQRTLLLDKYGGRKKKMTSRDRNRLAKVEDRERTIQRAVKRVDREEARMCGYLGTLCMPFSFVFGIVFFLLSLFLMVSLTMTLMDKLLDITGEDLSWKTGYSDASNKAFYPVDAMLTAAVDVFPIDYIIVTLLVYYFVFATMSGVKSLGVRMCHLQMFKIRPGRTPPQGMLFLAFILMFTMISLNVVLLSLAPQYVTFGNQVYVDSSSCGVSTDVPLAFAPVGACSMKPCDGNFGPQSVFRYTNSSTNSQQALLVFGSSLNHTAWQASGANEVCERSTDEIIAALNSSGFMGDDVDPDKPLRCLTNYEPCVQTRVAALLHSFFYNFWFLGATYYWCQWLACVVYFIALVYQTCKSRKSIIQSMINEVQSDFDDSDDDMTPFRPKGSAWTSKA